MCIFSIYFIYNKNNDGGELHLKNSSHNNFFKKIASIFIEKNKG